jgi:predicted NUDIX family NTP pyrophosphohydrolase
MSQVMIGSVDSKVKYRIIKPDGKIKYAGTGKDSWFTLEDARKKASKNDSIYLYDLRTMRQMGEIPSI